MPFLKVVINLRKCMEFPYSSMYLDIDPSFNNMLNKSMDDMSAINMKNILGKCLNMIIAKNSPIKGIKKNF